jgi:hypothetical protein
MEVERRARELSTVSDATVMSACMSRFRIGDMAVGLSSTPYLAYECAGNQNPVGRAKWRVLFVTYAATQADVQRRVRGSRGRDVLVFKNHCELLFLNSNGPTVSPEANGVVVDGRLAAERTTVNTVSRWDAAISPSRCPYR